MITPLIAIAIKEYISPAGSAAFAPNSEMVSAINTLSATSTGAAWNAVISMLNAASSALKAATKTFQKDSGWLALTNGFPSTAIPNLPATYPSTLQTATTYTLGQAQVILGGTPTNVAKFITTLNIAQGYISLANEYTNAASSVSAPLSANHWNMNLQTSNGLSGINLDFKNFGEDLAKSGIVIDFTKLEQLGNPAQLFATIKQAGGLYIVANTLNKYGLSIESLSDANNVVQITAVLTNVPGTYILNNGKGSSYSELQQLPNIINKLYQPTPSLVESATRIEGLTPAQQKLFYAVFKAITGNDLHSLCELLGVTTLNLDSAADLLDPTKLFPNSFSTLTVPIKTGFRPIYTDNTGSINTELAQFGKRLKHILPDNLAVANDALSCSLMQVKNIFNTDAVSLGNVISKLETNKGLLDIVNATSLVPSTVVTFWTAGADIGTGTNGQVLLTDVIGVVSGHNVTVPLQSINSIIQRLESDSALITLHYDAGASSASTGIFKVMTYALAGAYTSGVGTYSANIPGGVLGAGLYDNGGAGYVTVELLMDAVFMGTSALPGLLSIATSIISTLVLAYPTESTQCNQYMNEISDQLIREKLHQENADIVFADITGTKSTVLSFGQALSGYATDNTVTGVSHFLKSIANLSTLGGQATVAAMREARNNNQLVSLGIELDNLLDTNPVYTSEPSSGVAQYSADEVASLLLIS
jgi:hypothetical protein